MVQKGKEINIHSRTQIHILAQQRCKIYREKARDNRYKKKGLFRETERYMKQCPELRRKKMAGKYRIPEINKVR